MKSQARVVVVIGGGVMGVGLLYHLVEEGWTDVVLVEKGELTSGSTWHAAGLIPHFNGSLNLAKVHLYASQLYRRPGGGIGPGHGLARLRRDPARDPTRTKSTGSTTCRACCAAWARSAT